MSEVEQQVEQELIPLDTRQRHPGGRPTKYSVAHVRVAFELVRGGAVIEQVADHFGVCIATIYFWGKSHPEFSEAIGLGRKAVDDYVEAKMFHRAVGYSHPDIHISVFEGEVTLTPYMKNYPPDSRAATMWLTNRRGEAWKNVKTVDANLTVDQSAVLKPEDAEQYREARAKMIEVDDV